jgi:plasmid stabilization system protein ParE
LTTPVRVSIDASEELAQAAQWYNQQRRGLGEEFLAAIDDAIARIEDNPRIGSPVPGVADTDIRRVFTRRFPFHVVYIELPDRAQVLAIAHDRRRPAYWVGRIPL